jgi:hypothetical protein
VAVVALADPQDPARRLADPAATSTLARLARELSRRDDHVILTGSDEVVLVLADTPEDRAEALIRRLREGWRVEPERPGQLLGAAAGVTGPADRPRSRARSPRSGRSDP